MTSTEKYAGQTYAKYGVLVGHIKETPYTNKIK